MVFWIIARFLFYVILGYILFHLLAIFVVIAAYAMVYMESVQLRQGKRPEWYWPGFAAWMVRSDEKFLKECLRTVTTRFELSKTPYNVYVVWKSALVPCAMITYTHPVIYVPHSQISYFTREEWQFILAHEVGHWILEPTRNKNVRFLRAEVGCDFLGVALVGKACAIRTLQKLEALDGPNSGVKERILYIERLPDENF